MPIFSFPRIRRLPRAAPNGERAVARRVAEELETHVALWTETFVRRGMSPDEAEAAARRRFGNYQAAESSLIRAAYQREGVFRMRESLDALISDIRFAVRQLRRARGFAAFNVLTIALAVGLTTAVFAMIDAILLRPLPFPAASQLVELQGKDSSGNAVVVVSADNWNDWRQQNRTFTNIAIHTQNRMSVLIGGEAVGVRAEYVSPEFLAVVKPRFVWGRGFDERSSADFFTVVVSERFWRSALGAKTGPGLTVTMFGSRREVIGVVADGQEYPTATELWFPYQHRQVGGAARNNINWFAVGRLRPEASPQVAERDLTAIAQRIQASEPASLYSYGVAILPLKDFLIGDTRVYLQLLMAAVFAVLLIGIANLASANLARGVRRAGEMAVRSALGAGRGRVLRQLLIEHLVVALSGGAIGTLLAVGVVRAVRATSLDIPRLSELSIDARVLLFGIVTSAIAGVLTGILPALQASNDAPQRTMALSGRGNVKGGRGLPGRALVGAEVALSVVLVACAVLLVQSLRSVLARPLGFTTDRVIAAEITLDQPAYRAPGTKARYWQELLTAVRNDPQTAKAALVNWAPLSPGGVGAVEVDTTVVGDEPAIGYRAVSEGYFETLGIPVLQGRVFTDRDDATQGRVVIIGKAVAERYWPGRSPIGRRIRATNMESAFHNGEAPWLTVVGVVGDVRHYGYEAEPIPVMYVSSLQVPEREFGMTLIVRGRTATERLVETTRRIVRQLDPQIATSVRVLEEQARDRIATRSASMNVLLIFAFVALALAAIGVFGVLSFFVVQRRREMAVRAAIGASPRSIIELVVGSAARVVAIGLVAGVAGVYASAGVIRATLFDVVATDGKVLTLTCLVVAAVALIAALIPALRASRVDVREALVGE